MQIRHLSKQVGVPAKRIRYYERVGLLPPATRKQNGYREYEDADIERLRLVAGARRLDFSLDEIREILDLRDRGIAPCGVLLDLLDRKADAISQRISELRVLQKDLQDLYAAGQTFPADNVEGKDCLCHLVSEHSIIELNR
jgi:DNA-binding transcriptional MerR regulator